MPSPIPRCQRSMGGNSRMLQKARVVMASSPCDSGHQGYETAACEGYAGRPRRCPASCHQGRSGRRHGAHVLQPACNPGARRGCSGRLALPCAALMGRFLPVFRRFSGQNRTKTVQKPYKSVQIPYTPNDRENARTAICRAGYLPCGRSQATGIKRKCEQKSRDTPAPVRVQPPANSRQYRTDDRSSVDRRHKVGCASTNHANLAHLRTKIARKTGRISAKQPQNAP